MDRHGHIYALTEEEQEIAKSAMRHPAVEIREDAARLDGYLRGRAESDAPKRGKGANRDLAG